MNVHNRSSLTRSEHRRHDRLLVARFAMDDAYPGERDEVLKMIETCAECAALAADVRTVATAMPRLPVTPRTRDFTITAEQAERLHGSGFSRWLRTLAMPGWASLRPVAGVALSIGLVMAVVGAGMPDTPPAAEFRSDSGAAPADAQAPESITPMVNAPGDRPGQEGQFEAEIARETQDPVTGNLDSAYVAASPGADGDGAQRAQLAQSPPADPARDLLVYAGLIIAALSLALLALAWTARRYFADPFLR